MRFGWLRNALSYHFSETTWNYLFLINSKEDAGQLRRNKHDTEVHLKVFAAFVQQLYFLGPFSWR